MEESIRSIKTEDLGNSVYRLLDEQGRRYMLGCRIIQIPSNQILTPQIWVVTCELEKELDVAYKVNQKLEHVGSDGIPISDITKIPVLTCRDSP